MSPIVRAVLAMSELFCICSQPIGIHIEKLGQQFDGGLGADIERFHQRDSEGR